MLDADASTYREPDKDATEFPTREKKNDDDVMQPPVDDVMQPLADDVIQLSR